MDFRIGVDIGGTFTDFILAEAGEPVREAKVPSRPGNPGEALREGIGVLAEGLGLSDRELLARCGLLIHGTTVATNALIQGRGARTGLLCTSGFRDTLHMRDGYKENRYDFRYPPPVDLVPRWLRLPVNERVARDGEVLVALDEEGVREQLAVFRAHEVESVAVCFLWSFLNEAHERRVGEIVREELPDAHRSLSVDVLPEIRVYERLSTTVMNAFLGPVFVDYVSQIEAALSALGYGGAIRYVQCNGGLASGELMKRTPVLALNSGPAAAPAAGRFFGQLFDATDVLTIDMGGTSFDVCLLENGEPATAKNVDVHRYRLGIPIVDVNTIGAGGGSIATVSQGLLGVGPESAEAVPGPVCYGRGGVEPTVCDADIVLGYLNPTALLGGTFEVDKRAAEIAIEERIGAPLDLARVESSRAIFSLVNQNMVNAIEEVSVARGHDPRDFTLVIGGGSGAIHAASIARELGIRRVVIPKVASTMCAFGALVADLRHDHGLSYARRLADVDADHLEAAFAELEARGAAELAEEGIAADQAEFQRSLEMRYVHQVHECTVELPWKELTPARLDELDELFHQRYESLFAYAERDQPTEVITARVVALGHQPPVEARAAQVGVATTQPLVTRDVFWEDADATVPTPVYSGSELATGVVLAGPAIIEERHTTIVVPANATIVLDPGDAYLMEISATASPLAT